MAIVIIHVDAGAVLPVGDNVRELVKHNAEMDALVVKEHAHKVA